MGAVEDITQSVNGDGSSTVEIKLFPNQAVGQGQSLVVAYDPDSFSNALFDGAGNQVAAFQQAINNSSTAAPQDLIAPEVTSGNTDPSGQSISLSFNEQLQQLDVQQLETLNLLRIVVDGHELPSVDAIDSLSINNVLALLVLAILLSC